MIELTQYCVYIIYIINKKKIEIDRKYMLYIVQHQNTITPVFCLKLPKKYFLLKKYIL